MQYNNYNSIAVWSLKQHVSNYVGHHQVFYDVMRFGLFICGTCIVLCVCVCVCVCSGLCCLFRGL
jgi:hypothetical protein